jgi:zinc protease
MAQASERPSPGRPRRYRFPEFHRTVLDSGMQVITCHLPGRLLGSARLIVEAGSANEPDDQGGVAVLAARSIDEGTENLDSTAFSDAVENLGAVIDADANWDTFRTNLVVPMARMEPALELMADAVRRPAFDDREVKRIQHERLNEIRQEFAEPGPRAHMAFLQSVYTPESSYARPFDGTAETVERLSRDDIAAYYRRFATPGTATLVLAGDLEGGDWMRTVERLFGDWDVAEPDRRIPSAEEAIDETRTTLVHRPGSVQAQIVTGHLGLARRTPDFFPVTLLVTILGGLFTSRLNLKLREEKGYTYGARAWIDFRRQPGPFAASAAVESHVTAPALVDTLEVIRKVHEGGVTQEELDPARDYLIGVLPLRFETPEAISGAISNLVVHGLPDDYFDTYRTSMEAVTLDDIAEAARNRIRPSRMATVVVGDADELEEPLRQGGFGPLTIGHDPPLGTNPLDG